MDAVLAARSQLVSIGDQQGVSAIFQTAGNDACHVILRGGTAAARTTTPSTCQGLCARLATKSCRRS